nr:MAG TPA: hypothetical protein [Caudoviricetes sp.]
MTKHSKEKDDCGTCKYRKTRPKEFPCNRCSVNASGWVTSMWKKK